MRRGYTVGAEFFRNKKEMIERCRQILYAYKSGDTLSAEHTAFLRDLLEHHHTSEQKIGCGVSSMHVQPNGYGGKGFGLSRVDGSTTDFSFMSCINKRTPGAYFVAACRSAVLEQVLAVKRVAFQNYSTINCPITGEQITYYTCHVDHAPPNTFAEIYKAFVAARGIDPAAVQISGCEDNSTEKRIFDPDILADWQQYHREHAQLRVVSVRANLSIIPAQARSPRA